ncbi:2,3-bisphosphoglycerate-dependent phosphoglycerate mutase [Candidatus Levyibacteriota bacterium]|nr:2,3-bisphosphoglycerate-dependent phosphoglycerate mutase [Candidatus Levybacteria bacterium]MSU25908.1 2,3-bisphosphoglycerate-dependent phosphoglycerate mutase [Candidatus Levybacteria bacterium]GDX61950.1 2,3-bisphosphoglycerate-dependent phosphoglycerate mutase [Candidatus Levybacteria bacterium]
MAYLILVRHGITTYNENGLWSGWDDAPSLTKKGVEEAMRAGESIKDIHLDYAFSSSLKRAKETLDEIKKIINIQDIPTVSARELNERNYGDFTAKNKWDIKKIIGDDEFLKLRRSWNYPIPNGESLKQVYDRIIPYFKSTIIPIIKNNKNVIISSSGNALRALVKFLENISDDDIVDFEIGTGEVYIYNIDINGKLINKEIRAVNKNIS